jgi:hypothetical protein
MERHLESGALVLKEIQVTTSSIAIRVQGIRFEGGRYQSRGQKAHTLPL